MTPTSPNKLPSSPERDENIIDSVRSSNYNHLIEELSSFFDINPFARRIIKINIGKVEKLNKKLKNYSIRIKKVEYNYPFAFVTVMSDSVVHSTMTGTVANVIGRSLLQAFPQELYGNFANRDIVSPQGITKPDAQFYPMARPERSLLPTMVVEVGVCENKIELLRDVRDCFKIQEGDFVIEAAVVVKMKFGSRNGVECPGLLNKQFTGAIFQSYMRVVRADVTRDGRQEGWRELVQRETMESTVVLDGDDHIALTAYPTGIKFSVLVNHEEHQQAIKVPANLLSPDAQNDEDVVLLNEDDIIQITEEAFRAHEIRIARGAEK